MRHIAPRHTLELTLKIILELTLEVILELTLEVILRTCTWDKDHNIFNPGSRSNSLSLPRNYTGEKVMILFLVTVLELSQD
jgi:hypothetical protein